jgi:outer membrane biosynthesis protein TonB
MPLAAATRPACARARRLVWLAVHLVTLTAPNVARGAVYGPTVSGSDTQATFTWDANVIVPIGTTDIAWESVPASTSSCPVKSFDAYDNQLPGPVVSSYHHSRTLHNLAEGKYCVVTRTVNLLGWEYPNPPVLLNVSPASGRSPLSSIVTDGAVTASTTDNSQDTAHAWIAGSFTRVATFSGPGVLATDKNGQVNGSPLVDDGSVVAVTDDANGGYYIAGTFTRVGGVNIKQVAHILPDGGVDDTFNLNRVASNGVVNAIDFDSRLDRLYVGGSFTTWNGVQARNIVALNTSGARDTTFSTTAGTDTAVNAVLVDPRAKGSDPSKDQAGVYFGGTFETAFAPASPGGLPFSKIVKFEPSGAFAYGEQTFKNTNLNRSMAFASKSINGPVNALAYYDQGDSGTGTSQEIYQPLIVVGGAFSSVVYSSSPSNGTIATQTHKGIFFMDSMLGTRRADNLGANVMTDGAPLGDASGVGTGGVVNALSVSGNQLYVGGDFGSLFTKANVDLASMAMTQLMTTWTTTSAWASATSSTFNHFASTAGKHVDAIANGGGLYVGGDLASYNSIPERNFFKIKLTGAIDDGFKPGGGIDGVVHGIAVSGSSRYVGGDFSTYAGEPRPGLAQIDLASGGDPTVNAAFAPTGTALGTGIVTMTASPTRVYIGGTKANIAGTTNDYIAAFRRTDGGVDTAFKVKPNAGVMTIAIVGSHLWIGGTFTAVNFPSGALGVNCPTCANLAVLDSGSGAVVTSYGNFGADSAVRAIVPSEVGGVASVYVGGSFSSLRSVATHGLAKLIESTGLKDPAFVADPQATPAVRAIAVNGNDLYVSGLNRFEGVLLDLDLLPLNLGTLTAETPTGIAKLTADTGDYLTAFNDNASMPNFGDGATITSMVATDSRLYIAGSFTSPGTRLVVISTADASTLPITYAPDAPIATLGNFGQHLLAGGAFDVFDQRADRGGLAIAMDDIDSQPLESSVRTDPAAAIGVGNHQGATINVSVDVPADTLVISRTLQRQDAPFDPVTAGGCDVESATAWGGAGASWSLTPLNNGGGSEVTLPSITDTALAEGCHRYRVVTVKSDGSRRIDYPGRVAAWIELDHTVPGGSLSASTPSAYSYTHSLLVSGEVADAPPSGMGTGVASTTVSYSGPQNGTICTTSAEPQWECDWDTSLLTDGLYTVSMVVTDAAGNISGSIVWGSQVQVDNTAPYATVAALSNDSPVTSFQDQSGTVWYNATDSGSFRLTITASDLNNSIAPDVTYDLMTGAAGWSSTPDAGDAFADVAWSAGAAAPSALTNIVTDSVGHSVTKTVIVTEDSDDPGGASIAYDTTEHANAPVLDVRIGSDDSSGIRSVEVQREWATVDQDGVTCHSDWSGYSALSTIDPDESLAPNASQLLPDNSVDAGKCYRYQLVVTDNVNHSVVIGGSGPVVVGSASLRLREADGVSAANADVTEAVAGRTNTYTVRLNRRPDNSATNGGVNNATVTVAVTSEEPSRLRITSPVTLTFDKDDWNVTKTVSVEAIDDEYDQVADSGPVMVRMTVTSTDPAYQSNPPIEGSVLAHVADDDHLGLTITAPTSNTVVEGDTSKSVAVPVCLTSEPLPNAGVTLSVTDLDGQLDFNATTLAYTHDNWKTNCPTVFVTGKQDDVLEEPRVTATMRIAGLTGAGGYATLASSDVTFVVEEEDTKGFLITPSSNVLTIKEDAPAGATIKIKPTKRSQHDIVITGKPNNAAVTLEPTSQSQTIKAGTLDELTFVVHPVDNKDDEGANHASSIAWTVAASGPFSGAMIDNTNISITDDDVPAPRVTREVPTPPAATPSPETPKPKSKPQPKPKPKVVVPKPVPVPQVQQPATPPVRGPSVQRRPAAPKATPRKKASGVANWVGDHKTAAASAAAVGAAGIGAVAHGGMLGVLKGLVGGLDHLLDKHHGLNPRNFGKKNRMRLRELAKKKRRKPERERPFGKRRRKREEEDILDELRHKYDADYDDPLAEFERGPGSDRPDILNDLESRLRGFDLDDAA